MSKIIIVKERDPKDIPLIEKIQGFKKKEFCDLLKEKYPDNPAFDGHWESDGSIFDADLPDVRMEEE